MMASLPAEEAEARGGKDGQLFRAIWKTEGALAAAAFTEFAKGWFSLPETQETGGRGAELAVEACLETFATRWAASRKELA